MPAIMKMQIRCSKILAKCKH